MKFWTFSSANAVTGNNFENKERLVNSPLVGNEIILRCYAPFCAQLLEITDRRLPLQEWHLWKEWDKISHTNKTVTQQETVHPSRNSFHVPQFPVTVYSPHSTMDFFLKKNCNYKKANSKLILQFFYQILIQLKLVLWISIEKRLMCKCYGWLFVMKFFSITLL